jgi:predicted RNase H-like nuclease
MLAAGADGCGAGWICVTRELGAQEIASACFESARALFAQKPSPDLIAIDAPIGLTDAGTRDCDRAARREERRRPVDQHFGSAVCEVVRDRFLVRDVGHDDILDAFAALWSAERILRGVSQSLPDRAPTDCFGLRMEIVY